MKKKSSFAADLILALGSVVFLGVIIIAIVMNQTQHNLVFDYLPIVVAVSGIPVSILGIKFTKKIHHVFIGFELIYWGIILCLFMKQLLPHRFVQWWPTIGVTAGLFLFIAGPICYRSIKFRYFIPALVLFLMGIWFMLFTFGIIKVPFHIVALVGGPLFFIMTGISIIIFFMLQRKYTNLVIQDDETSDFDSEDNPENDKSDD